MFEQEKLRRAKAYMDQLANGINPMDGSAVPEESLINNVHLSRCFFFVSDVLRQLMESGSAAPKEKTKRPLEIPFEKRERFAYSETPISASEIARRVNDLVEQENCVKLTYSGILTWLTEIGMMQRASTGTKRPTEIGRENGISVEERMGRSGPYQLVVYDCAAQHFILDNLDAILDVENQTEKMRGAPWTKEEEARLLDLHRSSASTGEIAMTLRRSTSAVQGKLKKPLRAEEKNG